MMNRILKRPMFKMGGRADNDGILSLRNGYAEGDIVTTRADIEKEIYPNSLLGFANRVTGGVNDLLYNYGVRPLGNIAQFITKTNPEFIQPRNSKEEMIDLVLKSRGVNLGGDEDTEEDTGDARDDGMGAGGKQTEKGTGDSDTKTQELSDNDLKTMYEDLLPLFKSELSADEDELKRQKYLELAKFGANILAQPGGDLVGTIGKAAAPSIEGLTRVAETKRRSDAAAKSLALEAALKQADPGTIRKQVRDIMALDRSLTQKEALAKVLSTGSATREATKEGRIENYSTILLNSDYVKDEKAARDAAEAIEESGLGTGAFKKLPDSQDDLVKGDYYIKEDGSIRRFDGEKLLTPSDEGFK